MRILVSWIGHADFRCCAAGLPTDSPVRRAMHVAFGSSDSIVEGSGPIYTLVSQLQFDQIVLLSNAAIEFNEAFAAWLPVSVSVVRVQLAVPTDYGEIYGIVDRELKRLSQQHGDRPVDWCMHLSPGTPAMAVTWVLMGKSRYPATFYQTHKSKVQETKIPANFIVDLIPDMLYLREILERHNVNADRTVVGGATLDLGGFMAMVHQHDPQRRIRIGIEVAADDDKLEGGIDIAIAGDDEIFCNFSANGVIKMERYGVEVEVAWDEVQRQLFCSCYKVTINGQALISLRKDLPGRTPEFADADWQHPLFIAIRDLPDIDRSNEFPGAPINIHGAHVPKDWEEQGNDAVSYLGGFLQVMADTIGFDPRLDPRMQTVIPITEPYLPYRIESKGNDWMDFRVRDIISDILGQCLIGIGRRVLAELRAVRYLGPLRDMPPRGYRRWLTSIADGWASGLGAWDELTHSAELTETVSKTMTDDLKLDYSLHLERNVTIDLDGKWLTDLRYLLANWDDIDSEDAKRALLPLDNLPTFTDLQLHDIKRDIDIEPNDIGVGVSQVLPVVVGALARVPGRPPCSVFVVEQPELHVHPAVQVGLGDVFIRAIRDNPDRLLLVETHSEHLLLRLMRRMRETFEEKLPDSTLAATKADIQVLFVEVYEGGTLVREMPLNDAGELVKAWPGGFFEENLNEVFA